MESDNNTEERCFDFVYKLMQVLTLIAQPLEVPDDVNSKVSVTYLLQGGKVVLSYKGTQILLRMYLFIL